jgi:preprotein translocase subunit Sec61beta
MIFRRDIARTRLCPMHSIKKQIQLHHTIIIYNSLLMQLLLYIVVYLKLKRQEIIKIKIKPKPVVSDSSLTLRK